MDNPKKAASEDYDLEQALPYLLNRAGVRIGEVFSEELQRFNVSLPVWRVLASLEHRDGQTLSELSEHTSIELSTLSRLVAGMEKSGLLERTKSGVDKRAVLLSLSGTGRDLVSQIIPLADLCERIALAGIPAQDVALLKRLLVKVYENITALKPQPRRSGG